MHIPSILQQHLHAFISILHIPTICWRWFKQLVGFALLIGFMACQSNNQATDAPFSAPTQSIQPNNVFTSVQAAQIHLTKHAKCRMACRHIDLPEIVAVLHAGRINYAKSSLSNSNTCYQKYAIEGNTNDGQRIRIIAAACNNRVNIITVIDLGNEWRCNCN